VGEAGSGSEMSGGEDGPVYDLIDLETGMLAGTIRGDGVVVTGDPRVKERVAKAFDQEVMVRDGDLAEELGICFLDVQTLLPGDAGHAEVVIQNLGRLAGYLPRRRE
jgi:hypothetical protein